MNLRNELVSIALKWELSYGNAPSITSVLSEYDAIKLIGCNDENEIKSKMAISAVARGWDFEFNEEKYQIKANRPSGKKGSRVTLVPKVKNYNWDKFIWILYDKNYVMQEAWMFDVNLYRNLFENIKRLSPENYRQGKLLYKN
jgi:hypothetical protein